MAVIKSLEASIDVVEAAEIRIRNLFKNGVKIYLSFSGGKDSICIANVVYELIQKGEIDPKLLTVIFIDEEAIFPCVENIVKLWRKKFLMVGAKFEWFCLEVKHFNCFNKLSNDESFICWDRYKKDVWVRHPPSYAIKSNELLNDREENYQDFLKRYTMDGMNVIGVRTSESVQRRLYMGKMKKTITNDNKAFPIYDWSNNDVWLYLLNKRLEIPEAYLYLWQVGRRKNMMRISQFFSNDTAGVLVKMNEFYPELMKKVVEREPNSYLAMLYWDSEMFGRNSSRRQTLESENEDKINYKEKLIYVFNNMDKFFYTDNSRSVARSYKKTFIKNINLMTNQNIKRMYEALMAGDPKLRTLRAVIQDIKSDYVKKAERNKKEGLI